MSRRIDDNNPQPAHLDNIELNTRYDAGQYGYAPPPGTPPDRDSKHADTKGLLRSNETPGSNWPVHSQRAAAVTPLRMSLMVFDAVLASTPLMFLILAIIAARLNGKEVSDYGSRLAEILLLSPTIFPLIFAALMGRFFRHLGVYLAERGTTLGRLEQLIGCQSVFSALERQFCLRSWSIVGLLSVAVWLLSPVGGQAALRLFGQENNDVSSTVRLRYMNPTTFVDGSVLGGASAVNSGRPTFTSIFLAALLSSSKYQNTPMDLWGNVKLPIYRSIEKESPGEWKMVPNTTTHNATYASLIGIPLIGVPPSGFSNFNIKARQYDLMCSDNKLVNADEAAFGNKTATWKLRPLNPSKGCRNNTECAAPDCPNWPCPIVSKSLSDDPTGASDSRFSVANCEVTFEYFEAGVVCNGTSCAVNKMKKLDLLDDGYANGTDVFIRSVMITNELASLPTVDNFNVGSAVARGSTNMEKFIMNPDDFIGASFLSVQLHELSPEVFAERLTILYNTFWHSTYGSKAVGGNTPNSVLETGLLVTRTTNITFNSTEASTVRETMPVYKTNWRWFTALLVCSLVLLAASYIGLVLKYITLAPDIIGYAASLTMLNPYVPTPTGGTTLHGLERAALLHDLPVRIGDVCANEPVGAIAFAKADEGRVGRLNRKRYYI